jgi:DNA repair protein RecN (Recombination protein N)
LTENLVNIASQHDHQQLLVPRRHIDFLDSFGELWDLRLKFAGQYEKLQELKKLLAEEKLVAEGASPVETGEQLTAPESASP